MSRALLECCLSSSFLLAYLVLSDYLFLGPRVGFSDRFLFQHQETFL